MMEAVKIRLLFVDNNRSAIMVNISVVIALLNDDGFVAIPMITVSDDFTVAVPVTISVTLTNRYASTANTNSDLFSPSRHCAENYPGSRGTSVLPSGADIVSLPQHVRLVPILLKKVLFS
jgi:hypothetical protein